MTLAFHDGQMHYFTENLSWHLKLLLTKVTEHSCEACIIIYHTLFISVSTASYCNSVFIYKNKASFKFKNFCSAAELLLNFDIFTELGVLNTS